VTGGVGVTPVRSEVRAAVRSSAPGPRVSLWAGVTAVTASQFARVRVSRGPLLFVATLQSLGLLVLMRGVVHRDDVGTTSAAVAGSTLLVVAFVALNLLAQRFGALRASSALDYYGALPVSPAAVVLGTAVSYAGFAIPGAFLTAVVGLVLYGLPLSAVWMVLPAAVAAALALSGVGAWIGLAFPRPELATVAGQLAMTAFLFLGIIAPSHFPAVVRAVRDLVPGMLAVDALARSFRPDPDWAGITARLVASAAYGALALVAAGRAFRRAIDR